VVPLLLRAPRIDVSESVLPRAGSRLFSVSTCATFNVLPPENVSGDFIKIVQRVQVRICLDVPRGMGAVLHARIGRQAGTGNAWSDSQTGRCRAADLAI
jgi:multidrug resistance efflux pump